MAITVVNKKQTGSAAATTLAITNATKGNRIVVFLAQTASLVAPTVTDNLGGTYAVNATKAVNAASANSLWVAEKEAAGNENELKMTPGTGGVGQGIAYFELSGASSTVDVIVHTDNAASAKTVTSPSVTTTNAGDIVLAAVSDSTSAFGVISAWTGTGPMTNVETVSTRIFGGSYLPGSTLSGATFTANWETARVSCILVIALKPAGTESARTCGDTITISSTAVVGAFAPARTCADTVAISETVARAVALARTAGDTISVSDSAQSQLSKLRTAADTVSISDTASRAVLTLSRTAADTVSVSDQATRTSALGRTTGDPVTISSTAKVGFAVVRAIGDTVTITEGSSAARSFTRTVADTVSVSSTASAATREPVRDLKAMTVTAGSVVSIKLTNPLPLSLALT